MFHTLNEQILKGKQSFCASLVSIEQGALSPVTAARWLRHPNYKIFTALQEAARSTGGGSLCVALKQLWVKLHVTA